MEVRRRKTRAKSQRLAEEGEPRREIPEFLNDSRRAAPSELWRKPWVILEQQAGEHTLSQAPQAGVREELVQIPLDSEGARD